MPGLTSTPTDFPEGKEEKKAYLYELSCRIVDFIFKEPNTVDILAAECSSSTDRCGVCDGAITSVQVVTTCANSACQDGGHFHDGCIEKGEGDADWYCSTRCENAVIATRLVKESKKGKKGSDDEQDKNVDSTLEYASHMLYMALIQMSLRDAVSYVAWICVSVN